MQILSENISENVTAVITPSGETFSYSELQDFTEIFKEVIGKRTLLFILAENSIGSLAGYIASVQSRIVPLLLSSGTEKQLLGHLISTYQPEYLWVPEHEKENYTYEIVFSFNNYILLKTAFPTPKLHDNLALLLPTSGSTGSPKLVRHSYDNLLENAKNVSQVFEIKPTDRAMAVLPMYYTMGLSVISSYLYSGATVLLYEGSLTDASFWKFIKEERATSFTGVPFSFEILAKLRFLRMDLPHLTIISQGGGKMSATLFQDFASFATNSNKKFIATYGQTEGTARMAYLPSEFAMSKVGSIGKAIPNGQLYLVDEKGAIISTPDTKGEMIYEGPNVTLGYATQIEDLLKGDERNGVLPTGDIAVMDADGFFYIVGRVSRFLKLYGLRVSLDEIEQMIGNAFNTSVMCTGTDEQMKIYITQDGLSEAILSFLMKKTGIHHQAFEILYIPELPRNEAGKLLYKVD